ncbi:MAG: hypothetical protein OXC37_01065 [Bdellovibrionaceae bacterium]|nr:hypothetical protein [Pseudobdellovibrionaceae bacterium]
MKNITKLCQAYLSKFERIFEINQLMGCYHLKNVPNKKIPLNQGF